MKKSFLTGLALTGVSLMAQTVTPLWLRDVEISPDGRVLAFSYKGDIFTVPVTGGQAKRLTTLSSYEKKPVWSPDGKSIAFASDRNGGFDVFVMPSQGGTPVRLTSNSAAELPMAFTPDGKYVMFSAAIQDPAESAMFPSARLTEVYRVPVAGGRVTQVLGTPALEIDWLPDGQSFLYEDVKCQEDEFRKHHTSSASRDVWKYDAKTGRHTNLTDRPGEDRNPTLSPDGKTVYILSERDGGSFNVYSFPIDNPSAATKLTDFKTHPVRFLSQGADGTLAFAYNGEIYTKRGNAAPQKVNIDVTVDDENPVERLRVNRAREAAVSPDGKQLAFINRGEVFVTAVDHPSVKQISNTPEGECDLIWGANDREIIYVSERDGKYNIYKATIAREDDPNFSNATLVNEERMFPNDGVERTCPNLSPDGKQLAFIEDRNKLMVMDLATKKVRRLTDGSTHYHRNHGFDVQWSPDNKWLALEYNNPAHDAYPDIAIINVADGKMYQITESGYADGNPRWVLDGNALLFETERYGMRNHGSWGSQNDVMIAFLNKDAYEKFRLNEEDYALYKEVEKAQKKSDAKADKKDDKKGGKESEEKDKPAAKDIVVDLDNIEDRIVRLTPASSNLGDATLTKDGETLYYLAAFEGGYDLWKKDLRKGDVKLVNKLGGNHHSMMMDKEGNIFLIGSQIKKFEPKGEKMKNVTISTDMKLDPAKEREYMLRYVYNEEKERFYQPNMHGVDWDAMYANYQRFLPHINNNYDFANMLSELLGELNVSHTGGRYSASSADDPTASLGLLYDWTYDGKGLKVSEIIAKGPFDRASTSVKPGDIIEKINGQELAQSADFAPLLNNVAGKKTLVSFYDPKSGKRWEEVVLPISSGALNSLLYNRWVRNREADVEKWSNGKLGYVHIQGMNDPSFRDIYSKVLGKFANKEGIVIDTRWNGGGRLHEDIEVLFSGKKYITQEIHGNPTSIMPSKRWTKPSIMLIGEANYSNAHGTPWVYKHTGIGKLVGMPVPGTMTSVNWVTMQDPSLVFGIPVVGFRVDTGNYLENTQLEPDIKVANAPETVVKGEDTQLRKAVEELMKEVKK